MEKITDVAIIGCGLSGIALAKEIYPVPTLLLEKSKGIGGRIATRRLGSTFVNHGVEEFEVHHPILMSLIQDGLTLNLMKLSNEKAIPIGNLNQWIKTLSQNLNIEKEFEVNRIERKENELLLFNKNNSSIVRAKKIVICTPAPQAKALLEQSGYEADFLNPVRYQAQIQFFLLTKKNIPSDLENGADYYLKKSTAHGADLNLYHFEIREEKINQFLECSKEEISEHFLNYFKELKEIIIEHHSHKWRYSRVLAPIDPKFQFCLRDQHLFLCGDYFYGNDFNSAMKSVFDIAHAIRT